ncbi:MAG: hypothetical protein ACR5K6_00480 [Wolbachia sp.]
MLDNEAQQQGKHFDNILSQDRTISKGLEQVAIQLENSTITPVNTPKVNEISAGREDDPLDFSDLEKHLTMQYAV